MAVWRISSSLSRKDHTRTAAVAPKQAKFQAPIGPWMKQAPRKAGARGAHDMAAQLREAHKRIKLLKDDLGKSTQKGQSEWKDFCNGLRIGELLLVEFREFGLVVFSRKRIENRRQLVKGNQMHGTPSPASTRQA